MRREDFEHTVRAAGSLLGINTVLVIGSQAIHASIDFVLPEAERSIETDIAVLDDMDGSKADQIDGAIGELSSFQQEFGYYAQGVVPSTAVLPDGWRQRLIAYESPATNGITALCLEPHDLWISKAVAGRPKDREFCSALIRHEIVEPSTLRKRLGRVADLQDEVRERVESLIF